MRIFDKRRAPDRKARKNLSVYNFLFDENVYYVVFYEDTTADGILLNYEKFGMLYGNHIYIVLINML